MTARSPCLVPIDYSDGSLAALRLAGRVAAGLGTSLEIVHVWTAPYFGPGYGLEDAFPGGIPHPATLFDKAREGAVEELRAFAVKAALPPEVPLSLRVLSGEPAHEIVDLSLELSPEVVIIGTHGRTGLKRWLIGSVAERVVQHARCPVLTVPPGTPASETAMNISKILVPVDYSPGSKVALEYALSLADKLGAQLTVLHTWEVPPMLRPDITVWSGQVTANLADHVQHEAEKGMKEFLADAKADANPRVSSLVQGGQASSTILATAESGKFDLVCMGTHGRSGLAHLVLGSVAERIVRHSKCPVLTVRAPSVA